MRLVIALGGNALLRRGEAADAEVQFGNLAQAAPALARLASTNEVVIVHGNGPQVGLLARESGADPTLRRPYPLADLVAETQGLIGSWIQRALTESGSTRETAVLVSRAFVDSSDPALQKPTKFIGEPMRAADARRLAAQNGWTVGQDGDCWRRTVASPQPLEFLDETAARALLAAGLTVVTGGGGGIPWSDTGGRLRALDAVIDKDLMAGLIARRLDADRLVILTDVVGVIDGYRTEGEKLVRQTTPDELEKGSFPAGSMGPKVAAACSFTRATGKTSAIGALADAEAVIAGTQGTQISVANPSEAH